MNAITRPTTAYLLRHAAQIFAPLTLPNVDVSICAHHGEIHVQFMCPWEDGKSAVDYLGGLLELDPAEQHIDKSSYAHYSRVGENTGVQWDVVVCCPVGVTA